MIPIREVLLAIATLDGKGHGHVDVFVPGMESRIRDLFEKPRDIQDSTGKIAGTLTPWTVEFLNDLLEDGLRKHGFMGEYSGKQP